MSSSKSKMVRITTWTGVGALVLGLLLPIASVSLAAFSRDYANWLIRAYEPVARLSASGSASLVELISATPAIGIAMGLGSLLIYAWIGCWLIRAGLFLYRRVRTSGLRAE